MILLLTLTVPVGRAIAQGVVAGFSPRRPNFGPRSGYVWFVVDKVALGQVFSEYFGFLYQSSFHRLLHIHHHPSSGAGTIGQLVADVPRELSLTPPQEAKKKLLFEWTYTTLRSPRIQTETGGTGAILGQLSALVRFSKASAVPIRSHCRNCIQQLELLVANNYHDTRFIELSVD
jgi:hypothetical protein